MSAEAVGSATLAADPPSIDRLGRRLQRLATVLAVFSVAEAVALVVIGSLGDSKFYLEANLITIGFLGTVVLFPMMGALILQRRPFTRVAWLMIALGVGLGFGIVTAGYGLIGQAPDPLYSGRSFPLAMAALVISQLFFVPAFATMTTYILLLFPTDRLPDPRWRIAGWIAAAGSVLYVIGAIFRTGQLDSDALPGLMNPIGAPPELEQAIALVGNAGNALAAVGLLLGTASLIVRYRRADQVVAAQIRWLALVAVLVAASLIPSAADLGAFSDLAFGLGFTFLACMPIAIGIAITRYRLYDIDRLINRALVYGGLTAILAGVFTAAVGLAQRLFVAVTNQSSDAAIVGATLVVATLYAPLRKRLESIVDRRFKFEHERFGAYRDELTRLLSVTDPQRAAARLVREATRELGAVGGAVLDARGDTVATAGTWPVETVALVPIPNGSAVIGSLALGARPNGEPLDSRALALLEEIAGLAADAAARGEPRRR